ncbi:MAG: hypothetical protein K6E47_13115 [Lachnospiraceae bacterium]|nr:hypothetical protein [Lachnospiraceae bacterium]
MDWYENEQELKKAISFLLKYHCCYDWKVYATSSTPCYNYAIGDANISETLKDAIRRYYRNLSIEERKALNREIAFLLGERWFVKEDSIVKILSRILHEGNPANDRNKISVISIALRTQINQRIHLLEALKTIETQEDLK